MITAILVVTTCLAAAIISVIITKNPKNEVAETVEPIAESIIEKSTGINGEVVETAINAIVSEVDKPSEH